MILHRFARSLKEQNWAAITVEFVLLVAGVFLGIEAQQWSNERADRQLERVYLQRILSDIDVSIETNELNVARITENSDRLGMVVDRLRHCNLPEGERDAFADGVGHLARVGPSVFVLGTMEEMLSSGKFSIIRNAKIRDALNGLARDARYQDRVYAAKIGQIAAATAATNKRVIRIYADHKSPFDPVRWDELDIDFDAMCKDREFQGAVSSLRALADAGISLNNRALEKLRVAKDDVERELGRVPRTKGAAR